MPYRFWLPLLLMCLLAAEGALAAWAGTRMAMEASGIAAQQAGDVTDCDPVADAPEPPHAGHGQADALSHDFHDGDCVCGDSIHCDCVCVLVMYPPAKIGLFAARLPLPVFDVIPPMSELPANKLSRVFRPPIA